MLLAPPLTVLLLAYPFVAGDLLPGFARPRVAFCLLALCWTCVQAQPSAKPQDSKRSVVVRNVAVQHVPEGTTIEITSNGPLVPTVTKLNGPPRLVIDLPDAINNVRHQLGADASEIRGVRINQFQQNPPITRVVVDLVQPCNYAWEMVHDKLMVHLRPLEEAGQNSEQPTSATPVFTQGVQGVGSTSNVAGSAVVMLAGNRIAPGSSITAGDETAILNLTRGGQVRVCPGTTISVTTSQTGRDLMLGMSTGAIETHYPLASTSDSILTPDFRILLTGPGEFDFAFSADSKGNTCVRAMPGNTASAVVSELIGDDSYQVKPNEEVVFSGGQLAKIDKTIPADCGCPSAQIPVLRAESATPPQAADNVVATDPPNTAQDDNQPGDPGPTVATESLKRRSGDDSEMRAASAPESAPLPPAKANEGHVIVEAPLVFRASDPAPTPLNDAQNLPPLSRKSLAMTATALPPIPPQPVPAKAMLIITPEKSQPTSRGFFGSIKHFFAKIFG